MFYIDLRRNAKKYNQLFYYGFELKSFKNLSFIFSLICFTLMGFGFYLTSSKIFSFPYSSLVITILSLVFELLGIFLYFAHRISMIESKVIKVFGLKSAGLRKVEELKIKWLDENISTPREQYLELIKKVDGLEEVRSQYSNLGIYPFEKYLGFFTKIPNVGKLLVALIIPCIPIILKFIVDNKDLASNIINSFASYNILYNLILTISVVLVSGALLSMAASALVIMFDYVNDIVIDAGCSNTSFIRFKKDLIWLSKIEIEDINESSVKSRSNKIYLEDKKRE